MLRILTTFSGKFGDILWSLPTVRQIAKEYGKVDMMVMPQYHTLLPLLARQPYIDNALVNEAWLCVGSPHGDQPWCPQNNGELDWLYDKVFHLGYRHHPGIPQSGKSLIDFTAFQQGLVLDKPVLPFIEIDTWKNNTELPILAYSFNDDYKEQKLEFFGVLTQLCPDLLFVEVTNMPWETAASVIKGAIGFVGCKSSNHVVAFGVGQEHIFIYEPNPSRHLHGQFGVTFSCPYGNEYTTPLGTNPSQAARTAGTYVNSWRDQYANAQAITR